MNIPHEISSWLHIAFTEKSGQLMELYYYDKRDKQFYSTFITDYKAYNLLRELAGNS